MLGGMSANRFWEDDPQQEPQGVLLHFEAWTDEMHTREIPKGPLQWFVLADLERENPRPTSSRQLLNIRNRTFSLRKNV